MTPSAALGAALIAGAFGFLGALLGVLLRDFVAAPRNELAREERQRRREDLGFRVPRVGTLGG